MAPEDGDHGPVTGCAPSAFPATRFGTAALTNEIHQHACIHRAVLFMGAAGVPEVGPAHLRMSAADGIACARAFPDAAIFPLHFEGWRHFSQSRPQITAAFAQPDSNPVSIGRNPDFGRDLDRRAA